MKTWIDSDLQMNDYKSDYQMMLQEYIHDPAAPSFEELMQFMKELQERFRKIQYPPYYPFPS